MIGYRADATNKWVAADEKLHVCDVSTCLPDPPSQYGKPEDVWECLWHKKRCADLQVVGASCQGGQFQLKMPKNNLDLLGLPLGRNWLRSAMIKHHWRRTARCSGMYPFLLSLPS